MADDKIIHLYLKDGLVKIKMRDDLAPNHCNQVGSLIQGGFYNSLKFHRVLDGFMAQTGCPVGTGQAGINYSLEAEFSDEAHVRGTVSMARSQEPNSASTQFFICFADSSFLDKQYTVWGEVLEGMEFVDNIKRGDANNNGSVTDPDRIIRMVMANDDTD